ncbi:MAG: pseudouridine synthase [Polyangiales bacterium]
MADTSSAPPTILHHDDDFLMVAKPPGLPTTSPDPSAACLVRWVAEHVDGRRPPHATSRLDSPVSGLVTFALTRRANQHLLAARKSGEYARLYLGITTAAASFATARWDWPISIDPANRKLRVAGPGAGERDAATSCEVADRGDFAALLRLSPVTGRTHQLRVHAAKAGVALFGDHAYGAPRRHVLPSGRVVTATRVMLHCSRVSVPAMGSGVRLTVRAPAPADMERVWAQLGGTPGALR